jgi:hypothetical protein
MPTLQRGNKDPMVRWIKIRLWDQGFFRYKNLQPAPRFNENFTKELEDAVAYFQQTHLGPDGTPLVVSGIVGTPTFWALEHPTGPKQKSGLGPNHHTRIMNIPDGIGYQRAALLRCALEQYGIREQPNGSNRGTAPKGGVDKFLPGWQKEKPGKGPPWCCYFVSWVTHEVFGRYPLGRNYGSCARAWAKAMELGMAYPRVGDDGVLFHPMPGDAFYMRHTATTGHFGLVYRVSEDGRVINTVEGNCANRVKIGGRDVDERIHGFIDFFRERRHQDFEHGLIVAENVRKAGTR